jgi:TonB-linked SusC/RagA family outer membrane protein
MRKFTLLLAGLLLLWVQLLAQSHQIKGKIIDENGTPVPNASVIVVGTKRGTVTDADGNFTLTISETAKAVSFSAIGFAPLEVRINARGVINVSMRSTNRSLEDVVVIGYGTQKKENVTGSISAIKGSIIAEKPIQSFDDALGGRAAGVQITQQSGVVNSPPVFKIRGTNSLNLSSYPLIVIDGVPSYSGDVSGSLASANALSSINPNDIESIDIAKDAAATAIYGSRAANGVVFVTTKRGRHGKSKVTYDGWVGEIKPYRLWKMLDADQYMTIKNEGIANDNTERVSLGEAPLTDQYLPTNGPNGQPINTNWNKYVYRTGISHSHTVGISGGNDATTFYLSANYTFQEGILVKNNFTRKLFRFNVDHRANKLITLGLSANYSNELNEAAENSGSLNTEAYATAGLGRIALILPPNVAPYLNNGQYNLNGNAIGPMNNVLPDGKISYYNPLPIINMDRSNTTNNHIQSNIYLQLTPLNGLVFKTLYGIDYLNTDNESYLNPTEGDGNPTGSATSTLTKYSRWVWDNTLQYDHVFAKKHTLSLLAGTEEQYSLTDGFGLNRTSVSDPFYTNIQGGWQTTVASGLNLTDDYLVSEFGRLSYDFNKKYFVSGSIRQDGYSAFAPGHRFGVFPSVSAGWDISKEKFFYGVSGWLSGLKLRGSYGKVGNNAGINDYASYSLYGAGLYNGTASLSYTQAGNKNLQWETSSKTDVGFNFSLFKDLITGEFAYYYSNIDNLILDVPQSPSEGIPGNAINQNVGAMYNKGVEMTVNATPVNKRDFTWTTSLNFTDNKNIVTRLAPGVPYIVTSTSSLESVNITKPGLSASYFYVLRTAGVDPANGRRVFINASGTKVEYTQVAGAGQYQWSYLKDGTQAPAIGSQDQVAYKNAIPPIYGGFNNTFRYKGLQLDVLTTYQYGAWVYNGTRASALDQRFWNNSTDILRRWQKPGDITDIPRVVFGDNVSNGSANPIDANVQRGNFVKIKAATLSYNLPPSLVSKWNMNSLRVYVSGNNLFVITKYQGPDPEVSSNANSTTAPGVDRNTVANGRTLTIGLNVGF